jgi:hypothetical protein
MAVDGENALVVAVIEKKKYSPPRVIIITTYAIVRATHAVRNARLLTITYGLSTERAIVELVVLNTKNVRFVIQ